jgi:hypothetical protein
MAFFPCHCNGPCAPIHHIFSIKAVSLRHTHWAYIHTKLKNTEPHPPACTSCRLQLVIFKAANMLPFNIFIPPCKDVKQHGPPGNHEFTVTHNPDASMFSLWSSQVYLVTPPLVSFDPKPLNPNQRIMCQKHQILVKCYLQFACNM